MKSSFLVTLGLIAVLAIVVNTQSGYDPNINYNFTFIQNWPYTKDPLQWCQVVSSDGATCQTCKDGFIKGPDPQGGPDSCMLEFPPDNCHAIDFKYNCVLCHDGYFMLVRLDNYNLCLPKTTGCEVYDQTAQHCKKCLPGWSLNTTVNTASNLIENHCFFIRDTNCLQYDANNVCLSCATNYVLNNNRCIFWLPNCSSMNGIVCQKCNTNYQLDAYGRCVLIPRIPDCAYQVDSVCEACVAGYSLVSNQCVFNIANCAQVNGRVCAKCNVNYFITNDGKCEAIPKIPNCNQQTDYTCNSCDNGWTLSQNACVYVIENCAQVNNMVCGKCNTNYEVNGDGKCSSIPKISNCVSQTDYTCQACEQGWALSNNRCTYIIENCAQVDGFACLKCNSGFYISPDGKCQSIPKVANCLTQVDFTCQSCLAGYTLINNQCSFVIQNCAKVNGVLCIQCNNGFSLTNDGKCQSIPQIPNCASQINNVCQSCVTGFSLSNNQCIALTPATTTIPNCLEQNRNLCVRCQSGYMLSRTGTCALSPFRIANCANQISVTCTLCNPGFTLANNTCVVNIPNCLKTLGNVCQQCIEGFITVPNGQCVEDPFYGLDLNCRLYDQATFKKCLACSGGFFLNSVGKCQQVDPLCRSHNSNNGFCLSCYVGFSLNSSSGKCIKTTPLSSSDLDYCHQYDYVNNVCVKCAEGCYFDTNGKCQKFSDVNCKTPSNDLKSCSECYKGYVFDSSQAKCIIGEFNCATWSNGRCATCPKGYVLDASSNCVLVDPYCNILNPFTRICVICYPGYILDTDKKCKPVQQTAPQVAKYSLNCAKFTDGQCTDCYFGFYVKRDTVGSYCEKVNDLCRSFNKTNGKCTACYLGYYLSGQGECLRYF